ncbi:MAG: hypothetical protein ABIB71_03650 [Candidatus Woesearchaeota archaeon]
MVAIHLNKTVDDIFSGYSKLETPDEKIEHKVDGSLICNDFEDLMKQYETFLVWEVYLKEVKDILTPEQINSFLQATIRYDDYKHYRCNTGHFITRLIQNSHNAGNNKFILNTKALSKKIDCIAHSLKGKKDMLLEIIVDGNLGDYCGLRAENIEKIYICGNVGRRCGENVQNIGKLYISGDAGNYCCERAKSIKELYIGGNAGNACGYKAENIGKIYIGRDAGANCAWDAKNIGKLHIAGNVGSDCGFGAENSTFKTPNKETLRLLKKNVPIGEGNKIYSIQPNGKEKRIGRLMEILNYRLW